MNQRNSASIFWSFQTFLSKMKTFSSKENCGFFKKELHFNLNKNES